MKRITKGQEVEVQRDITRNEGPYAKKGEQGKVLVTFRSDTGANERKWSAQVVMYPLSDRPLVKTFRLTSLRVLRKGEAKPGDYGLTK